jgi:hypothetical protein
MLTPMIVKDIHNQQVREMERVQPDGGRSEAAPGSMLRQKVGRGLIRVGNALASESPRQNASPC